MGIESANYMIAPSGDMGALSRILLDLGCNLRSSSGELERWVLSGERYWIDVMIGPLGPNRTLAISVRLALSNPIEAIDVLRRVLSELLSHVSGELFDSQTGKAHSAMSDESWESIREGLTKKQEEFQQYFGPFEAPVSGDDVFAALRTRRGS